MKRIPMIMMAALWLNATLAQASTHTAASAGFATDTRDYSLEVTSAHGDPNPAAGLQDIYAWHATVTLHPCDHGSIAEANSGDDYVTTVDDGAAFPTVTVNTDAGYTFTGWDPAAPDNLSAEFEAIAQYEQTGSVAFEQIAEFEVDEGVSYVRTWGDVRTRSIYYGGACVDESGELNLAYQDYQEIKFVRIALSGTVMEDTVVNTVSKKAGYPVLARNGQNIYLLGRQWEKRYGSGSWPTYASFWDAQLYSRSLSGGSWSQLHIIHNDVYGEAGGPDDIAEAIMPDPAGNMHILYSRHGWWSNGSSQRDRILNTLDNSVGGLISVATRSGSADANRNHQMIGQLYLDENDNLVKPMTDLVDTSSSSANNVLWMSEASAIGYSSWTQGSNQKSLGNRYGSSFFQDEAGDIHAVFRDHSTGKQYYSLNWDDAELISDSVTANSHSDITIVGDTIYVLVTPRDTAHSNGNGNLLLFTKSIAGGDWSEPTQITSETNWYNNHLIGHAFFARPFTYKTEPTALYVVYEAYDGTRSGNDYLGGHVRVLKIGDTSTPPETHTVTLYPGEHGSITEANSGSHYVTTVSDGAAFPTVTVNPEAGYTFTGWDPALPATVSGEFEATAQYVAADDDNDGLPNAFEDAIIVADLTDDITDYSDIDGTGDFDRDGRTDAQEFADGTDPTDPGSTLGLLTYHPFRGDATDASGNGNDLATGGAVLAVDRFGNVDSAYRFDGASSGMEAAVGPEFSVQALTISVWFRVTGPGTWNPRLVAVGPAGTSYQHYMLTIRGSADWTSRQVISSPANNWVGDVGSVATVGPGDGWIHVAATYKNQQFAEIFVNGELDNEWAFPHNLPSFSSGRLQVGWSNSGYDLFEGLIDEVRIYDRALSADEVARLYAETAPPEDIIPDISLSSSSLRILDTSGNETANPSVGETVNLEVTVSNNGDAATAEAIEVHVFEGSVPTDLTSYNLGSYIVAASTTVAESIPVGGSRTVILPWTIDGGDRISSLTAVVEFADNRVASQQNYDNTTSDPLPVGEWSFNNNSAARSVQIGTPDPTGYGITMIVDPIDYPQSGVAYTLSGTAAYDWGDENPVLGADVTVQLNGATVDTDRTAGPDGNWSVGLPGMASGLNTVFISVTDGGLTGTETLVLDVAAGAQTTDLRVTGIGYESGVYRTSGETGWASVGSDVVLKALVRNDGNTAAAGDFSVAFKAPDGSTIATETVESLDAFSQTWVTAQTAWTTSATGAQSVSVECDSAGAITETNEDNNSRSATVHVSDDLPDLVVSDISWAGTPREGDLVAVTATIRNDGPGTLASGPSVDVGFSLAGSVTDTASVALLSDLAYGETTTAQVTLSTAGLGVGGVSLSAEVDTGAVVAELDESNNTRTETLRIATALPDLIVSDISWTPSSPKDGDTVTVTATIRNNGGSAVSAGTSFDVGMDIDGSSTVAHTLNSDLAPGASVNVATTWTAVTGNQSVTATADSGSVIEEDYESNNTRSETISVRAALPDLRPYSLRYGWQEVSGLSFSPSAPVAGDAATITLQVWNVGTVAVPTGSYAVEFTADGTPFATELLVLAEPLQPGASTTLQANWTASGDGGVSIAASVDSTTALTEENEGNNGTAKSLTVYPASAGVNVSGLVPSVWQPFPNTAITLTVTVVNSGGQPSAGGHVVTFYDGDPDAGGMEIGTETITDPMAAKGGSSNAAVNWTTPATPQTVTVYAVCEGNERTVDVVVTNTPAPDLAIYSSDISVSNPLPAEGASISVSADVRNLAGGASDVSVVFEYNTAGLWLPLGEPVIVYQLAAGETETVNATQTLTATAYYYTVRVTVTPTAHTDANAGDNAATTSFRRADAPWANAGADQEVWTGETVTLDGSASTHANTYQWTLVSQPVGSTAAWSNASTVSPSFTADIAGSYEVRLIVSDGSIDSPADSVLITVTDGTPTDLTLAPATVAENAPADTLVGTLTASGGSGSYSYGLVEGDGDMDNALFEIDGSDLKVAGLLDYEVQSTAAIRVRVTDTNSGNHCEEALTITISDDDNEDGDNDGLTDAQEDAAGTSRTNPDSDGDGLLDSDEVNTHGTNPLLADTDGDKLGDGFEVTNAALGANPKLDQSALFAEWAKVIRNSPVEQQAHGLYTEDAIRMIYVGAPLIGVTNGEVRLELQLQKSNDLETWQPFGDPVEWIDTPADKAFYRLFFDSTKP